MLEKTLLDSAFEVAKQLGKSEADHAAIFRQNQELKDELQILKGREDRFYAEAERRRKEDSIDLRIANAAIFLRKAADAYYQHVDLHPRGSFADRKRLGKALEDCIKAVRAIEDEDIPF